MTWPPRPSLRSRPWLVRIANRYYFQTNILYMIIISKLLDEFNKNASYNNNYTQLLPRTHIYNNNIDGSTARRSTSPLALPKNVRGRWRWRGGGGETVDCIGLLAEKTRWRRSGTVFCDARVYLDRGRAKTEWNVSEGNSLRHSRRLLLSAYVYAVFMYSIYTLYI